MYSLDDPTFENSRECTLIQNLLIEIENKNSEGYTNTISDYNQITPFSKLQTSLLVRAKDQYLPENYS